ncbi:MAG: hypothetical protein ACOC3X_02125 [Nanoarchaeota archaeon]
MDIDDFLDLEISKQGMKAGSSGKLKNNDELFSELDNLKHVVAQKDFFTALNNLINLKHKYHDLTKKQLNENRFIFNELIKINSDLISKIDLIKQDLYKKINLIQNLIVDAQTKLNEGNISEANKIYLQTKNLIKDIPDILIEEKKALNNQLTAFYVSYSVLIQKKSEQIFIEKKDYLLNVIKKAYEYIKSGNKFPLKTFEHINKLFNDLPEGHLYQKAIIYNDILKLFRTAALSEENSNIVNTIISQTLNLNNEHLVKKPTNLDSEKKAINLDSQKNINN